MFDDKSLPSIQILSPIGGLLLVLYNIFHIWGRFFSPQVKLRADLQLLKLAREAGIKTLDMEAGVEQRIRAYYLPEKEGGDPVNEKEEDTVSFERDLGRSYYRW
jgi:hypothetical protein